MKHLIDHISNRVDDSPLIFHGDVALSSGQVLERVNAIRSSDTCLRGNRCHVQSDNGQGENDLDAILSLIAADGWSAAIVMGSSGERPTELSELPTTCDTRWHLATSGTTGEPKWVAHSLASLTRSLKVDSSKGATVRWGLLYDPCRFAGLQVVLQALLGGSSLVIPSDRTNFIQTVSEFQSHRVNALSTTPSYWRKLLMAGIAENLDLRLVTLGGEIADATLLVALQEAFPQARVTHIYASTEAGVGFAVSDGQAGFPAEFLDRPAQGVELKVDERGQLLVRSQETPASYADGTSITDRQGWVPTGDLVEKRGDRYCFLGRTNRVINVGGDKVHPKEIEDVALSVPGVALAHVRAKSNAIVGQVPELFVEPSSDVATDDADRTALRETVLERCRAELPRVKWPAKVTIVDELQLSAAGKLVGTSPQGTVSNGDGFKEGVSHAV
ncbi:ANL family adenylate-forming protein [Adhaeretor mobilis]|uniref:2-succinylbenzoate--CoA ligase n=1 Tax=Adhaeretor mobilis TaxID=1930276 RepID=A0A517MQ04_9BACT|nr:fatty acid--CoA ligase family protein [Adhaeretor mobilis]QDS96965.1 2-succinylbenzoate--CoA ligase [Adhaeretor mobilis]